MKLLTLTGPSCSGKTTMLNELVANHGFKAVVSHTTRLPRKGEVDGVDYYFVSETWFNAALKENKFVESITFNGASYGVSVSEIQGISNTGKTPILIVEPTGLTQVKAYCLKHGITLKTVYTKGDLKNLVNRYLARSADVDFSDPILREIHAKRISSISIECTFWPNAFDYDMRCAYLDEDTFESEIVAIKKLIGSV